MLLNDKNEGKHDRTQIEQTHADVADLTSGAIAAMTMQVDMQGQSKCYTLLPPTTDKLL